MIEGNSDVKLLMIWTDGKAEGVRAREKRGRKKSREEKESEESRCKESEESRCRCAKR